MTTTRNQRSVSIRSAAIAVVGSTFRESARQKDFGKGGKDFGKGGQDFGKEGKDFGKDGKDYGKGVRTPAREVRTAAKGTRAFVSIALRSATRLGVSQP